MSDDDRALRMKIYRQSVHTVKDFKKKEVDSAKFMVVEDDSYTAMGHDYGPPDPPPTMETHNTIRVTMLHTEEEVVAWVKQRSEDRYAKAYQIFKVDPVNINTSISVSLG